MADMPKTMNGKNGSLHHESLDGIGEFINYKWKQRIAGLSMDCHITDGLLDYERINKLQDIKGSQ